MKSRQLLIAAIALCGLLLLWWVAGVESNMAVLRAEVANAQAARAAGGSSQRGDAPRASARDSVSSSSAGFENTLSELELARDRIAELEGTVKELADAWNRFAADEEARRKKASMRGWGPEQATGPPDTPNAGDQVTAWAPATADGGMEWLQTEYEKPVEVSAVRVFENEGPGAIVKVTAVLPSGSETVLWTGLGSQLLVAPAEQAFSAPAGVVAQSIRVYLDTSKVPGWNEIDAVELIGRDGSRQWATSASASSTYADGMADGVTVLDGRAGQLQFLLR